MRTWLVAILVGLASSARAAEPRPLGDVQVPDARLSDADQFGRFVDLSGRRADKVVAPQWRGDWTPRPQAPAAASLQAPRPVVPEPTVFVPLQKLPPLEDTGEGKPRSDSIGLWTLGAVGLGLGLMALGISGPRRRERVEEEAPRRRARREAALEEELPPVTRWNSPELPLPFGPIAEPRATAEEPAPRSPRGSWYAITAAEQRAIDAWDKSPEKRLGIASLPEWLDRHESRLPEVDVPLLKAKLERTA